MKFTCDSTLFRKTLEHVIRASAPTSPIPALSQVRITTSKDRVTLACTNDLMQLSGEFEAKVEKHGATCVTTKKLLPLLVGEEEIAFKAETQATIKTARSLYKLPVMEAEEFPAFPVGVGGETQVEWGAFADSLKRVLPAVAKETGGKAALTGVEVWRTPQEIRLTATDTHIMARCSLPQDEWPAAEFEQKAILPKAVAVELTKLPHSERSCFSEDGNEAWFEVGDYHLACRLISGAFPNCESVLKREVIGGFVVEREPLIAAIKRLISVSQDDMNRLTLTFEGSDLKVVANAKDLGEGTETLSCHGDIPNAITTLHSEQLLSLLTVWGGEEVAFGYEAYNRPIHLYPMDGGDYHGVIMPLAAA